MQPAIFTAFGVGTAAIATNACVSSLSVLRLQELHVGPRMTPTNYAAVHNILKSVESPRLYVITTTRAAALANLQCTVGS